RTGCTAEREQRGGRQVAAQMVIIRNRKPGTFIYTPLGCLREVAALAVLCVASLPAQQGSDPSPQRVPASPLEDKRIFGVLPNNRTAEAYLPFHRLTAKQKMTIAAKDSFDWPVYPTAAAFAALYQLEDQNHSYGQGMARYGK